MKEEGAEREEQEVTVRVERRTIRVMALTSAARSRMTCSMENRMKNEETIWSRQCVVQS